METPPIVPINEEMELLGKTLTPDDPLPEDPQHSNQIDPSCGPPKSGHRCLDNYECLMEELRADAAKDCAGKNINYKPTRPRDSKVDVLSWSNEDFSSPSEALSFLQRLILTEGAHWKFSLQALVQALVPNDTAASCENSEKNDRVITVHKDVQFHDDPFLYKEMPAGKEQLTVMPFHGRGAQSKKDAEVDQKALAKAYAKGHWLCCACSKNLGCAPYSATINKEKANDRKCWKCPHSHCDNCPDSGNHLFEIVEQVTLQGLLGHQA